MMDKKKWQSTKRKAPKVPDDTCPIIDSVLDRLDFLTIFTAYFSNGLCL